MFEFLVTFLLLRNTSLPRFVRYACSLFIVGLVIVVLAYTTNLFLTLNERTAAPHVHTHSSR